MKIILALLAMAFATPALASPCDNLFPNKKEIVVPGTKVLCNSFFVTVYDTKHEANVFSSEIALPTTTGPEVRTNDFRADNRVDNSPSPSDYDRTGYDRGHMTPADDAKTPTQMSDTFLQTNMTPQKPTVNRDSWRLLESKVRKMKYINIVTGAVYAANYQPTIGKHKVPVPVALWKVVFLADGTVQAFEAKNVDNAPVVATTVTEIEKQVNYRLH